MPPTKPKHHHAIIYTDEPEPLPLPSEQVLNEPPMGDSIRVIANSPSKKMDPKSRVNFAKPYTVEHNVKVEDFGRVDPNDEWKLIAQFNSHWGIPGSNALPPATRFSHRNSQVNETGPRSSAPSYTALGASTAPQPINDRRHMPPAPHNTFGMSPIDENIASGQRAGYRVPDQSIQPNNTDDFLVIDEDDSENPDTRRSHHRRSGSHSSHRDHGSYGRRR